MGHEDVKEQIYKLAKKGLRPSQIGSLKIRCVFNFHQKLKFIEILFSGVILRDSHGVAQVRWVTGNKILRILKAKGLAPEIPEDLYHLIKKAVNIRKHMERNRKVSQTQFLDEKNQQNLFGLSIFLG